MKDRFEMRRNVLTGVVEYRRRDGRRLPFRSLTQYAVNSMTQDALMEGLKSWDKDAQRYINSDNIEEFDPINDHLEQRAEWAGTDRIGARAARGPAAAADWHRNFPGGVVSMVAHRRGKGLLQGNAYTP